MPRTEASRPRSLTSSSRRAASSRSWMRLNARAWRPRSVLARRTRSLSRPAGLPLALAQAQEAVEQPEIARERGEEPRAEDQAEDLGRPEVGHEVEERGRG